MSRPCAPPIASRLGFGCSALLGPQNTSEASRLLEIALNAGVTHFDAARSYGSGDVERVLGTFVKAHRDEVSFTTKFGIATRAGMSQREGVKRLARRVMRVSPRLRAVLGRGGARMVNRGRFSPAQAKASIEESLLALGLDRIDVVLLHDATIDDCSDDLLATLRELQEAGTIGTFGVGTGRAEARDVVTDRPEFGAVLQFPSDVSQPTVRELAGSVRGYPITYGAMSALPRLRSVLANDELALSWSEQLDMDVRQPATLAGLALAHAVAGNPQGTVLFRSTDPARITANAAVVDGELDNPVRLSRFEQLVRGLPARDET